MNAMPQVPAGEAAGTQAVVGFVPRRNVWGPSSMKAMPGDAVEGSVCPERGPLLQLGGREVVVASFLEGDPVRQLLELGGLRLEITYEQRLQAYVQIVNITSTGQNRMWWGSISGGPVSGLKFERSVKPPTGENKVRSGWSMWYVV